MILVILNNLLYINLESLIFNKYIIEIIPNIDIIIVIVFIKNNGIKTLYIGKIDNPKKISIIEKYNFVFVYHMYLYFLKKIMFNDSPIILVKQINITNNNVYKIVGDNNNLSIIIYKHITFNTIFFIINHKKLDLK